MLSNREWKEKSFRVEFLEFFKFNRLCFFLLHHPSDGLGWKTSWELGSDVRISYGRDIAADRKRKVVFDMAQQTADFYENFPSQSSKFAFPFWKVFLFSAFFNKDLCSPRFVENESRQHSSIIIFLLALEMISNALLMEERKKLRLQTTLKNWNISSHNSRARCKATTRS